MSFTSDVRAGLSDVGVLRRDIRDNTSGNTPFTLALHPLIGWHTICSTCLRHFAASLGRNAAQPLDLPYAGGPINAQRRLSLPPYIY